MKLSFIVPAYNAERTLGDCLDSLLDQDLSTSDYEIIVVNDGSTDRTADIIAQYKVKSQVAIRCVEQVNQGVSVARNVGVEYSIADYIWYIDADDVITTNCIKSLY